MCAWADGAVSDEACALCDDESACGDIALNFGVFCEGEAVVCGDGAADFAVDDDALCFNGGVAFCAVSDLDLALSDDFALELSEDSCGFFEEHLALDACIWANHGEFGCGVGVGHWAFLGERHMSRVRENRGRLGGCLFGYKYCEVRRPWCSAAILG